MLQGTVMTMNRSGALEVNHGKPSLPIGCSVYLFGAGMSETDGCVISNEDEHGAQKCVTMSEYDPRFFTIDKYSRPLSKKFGIGVYYDDELTVSYSSEEIEQAIERATAADAKKEKEAKEYKEQYAAAKVEVVKQYPMLTPLTSSYDKKATKVNLVALLKHTFAGIYFSVRCSHGYSYDITWENGPTVDEVKEQTDKFRNSYFDGMTDSTVHYDNAFADVFGSLDYISCHRKMNDNVREFMPVNENVNYHDDATRDFHRAFDKTSFPAAAKVTAYDAITDTFTFTTPDVVAKEEGTAGNLWIEDYSEKSFVVKGDTYPIREQLKSFGGVWLRGPKCWCYSLKKKEEIAAALGIALG